MTDFQEISRPQNWGPGKHLHMTHFQRNLKKLKLWSPGDLHMTDSHTNLKNSKFGSPGTFGRTRLGLGMFNTAGFVVTDSLQHKGSFDFKYKHINTLWYFPKHCFMCF